MKNSLVVAPLEVEPVLYMADGTDYRLSPVLLPIAGVGAVNINDALARAPAAVLTHLSTFGTVSLTYRYPSGGHLVASIYLQDTSRSLSFMFPFDEPSLNQQHSDPQQTIWDGVWWKHDADVQGFVAVSNVTAEATQATIRLISAGGAFTRPRRLDLPAHSTQILLLEHTRDGLGAEGLAGGVRVEYFGERHAIVVGGGLLNAKEGYSANIPFVTNISSQEGPISFGSAGIMVGKPDAMMRFPADTKFTPYFVLRNNTTRPIAISMQLSYMTDTVPVTSQAQQSLAPLATKRVNLPDLMRSRGMKDFNGSISLGISYSGLLGDIVMATGSVDQSGTYVFGVEPQVVASTNRKVGSYWDLSQGSNTMYSLWNPTDKAQDVMITLYHERGKYKLPLHLAPQASLTLDIKNIVEANAPDAAGNAFPANTTEGSATFESADGPNAQMKVVISGAVFNVATGTCGICCIPCCGTTDVVLSASGDSCAVGDTIQFRAMADQCDGSTLDETAAASWRSDNTTVATIDSSGLMTGAGPGTANISFNVTLGADESCGYPYPGECPPTNFGASAPIPVQVPDHLFVLSDKITTLDCSPNPSTLARQITYEIQDQSNTQLGTFINIRETVPSPTISSCTGKPVTTTSSCTSTLLSPPRVIGEFTDSLLPGCPNSQSNSPCGFTFPNQQWQWCPASGSPQSTGTVGPVNAENTLINVNGNVLGFFRGTIIPK